MRPRVHAGQVPLRVGVLRAGTDAATSARMGRRWKIRAATASTFPPPGLFTQDAATIARVMATRRVSPKGLGSAIRMVQYMLNRAGRNLPARRRRELERAKRLLQARAAKQGQRR